MIGRRVYFDQGGWFRLDPGDYIRTADGTWMCRVPDPRFRQSGSLETHQVEEHNDGTITVIPSILHTEPDVGQWHGYLEHGIWREV